MEILCDTFLGLDPGENTYDQSRVVVLRAPYEGTVSYGVGARLGPAAILAASAQVETWDVELGRELSGIHTLPALAPVAAGPEQMVLQVEQACTGPMRDGKWVLCLGGEHTVAVGAARAAAACCGELSILQIDAHLDLRQSYEGSPHSHACTARRLLELGRVVAVGVRTACPEELEVVEACSLDPVWAHEVHQARGQEWIARALDQLGPRVYVTVDVDGLDPSVIPGTGTPVPGGLTWQQTLALLRTVGEKRQVVGCDLCELAPIAGQQVSQFAAALLACKMIGYFVR